MNTPWIVYVIARARVVQAINRVMTFNRVSSELNDDLFNAEKYAKLEKMLSKLNNIYQCLEENE